MSLHPLVRHDLLTTEAAVARDRLSERVTDIVAAGDIVEVTFTAHDRPWRLRLTGTDYDRLPVSVSFVDDAGNDLTAEGWPPGLYFGSLHPVLNKPWVCLRGTLEYHLYTGHTAGGDSWDANRADHRLADVISHILERCGR